VSSGRAEAAEGVDPNDPEIRRAKLVLFVTTIVVLSAAIAVMLIFFQPEGQLLVERWPNGYPKSETRTVQDEFGRPLEHGEHRAWHENGQLAQRGRYERGLRTGKWSFWNQDGLLDAASTGNYQKGLRIGPGTASDH
jgi:hypothetical protein